MSTSVRGIVIARRPTHIDAFSAVPKGGAHIGGQDADQRSKTSEGRSRQHTGGRCL